MKKTRQARPGDFWAHLLADIAARLGFFIVTALFLIVGFHFMVVADAETRRAELLAVIALSTLAAVVGPWLWRQDEHRGRGSLAETRSRSRRGPPGA
ncbi:MAG: hypothetical protein KF886_15840 [Candidatus Hydrogenedentes bacterium]|nr:hypothetical protein [Candidatus Hydrogenedentota bacterium]